MTVSILVENYVQLEVLLKEFVLMAPSINKALVEGGYTVRLKAALQFQEFTNKVQRHLES